MRLVYLESPYAAPDDDGVMENVHYARRCVRDCLERGESPYASHLFFTQPGVLDDRVPEERKKGMEAGFSWGERADATVVYVDRGISKGMVEGIRRAFQNERPVEYRSLWISLIEVAKTVEAAGLRWVMGARPFPGGGAGGVRGSECD